MTYLHPDLTTPPAPVDRHGPLKPMAIKKSELYSSPLIEMRG